MRANRLPLASGVLPLVMVLAACGAPETPPETPAEAPSGASAGTPATARAPVGANASANLVNAGGEPLGQVTVRQGPTGVLIRVEATGLTPGWHGLHLHQVGQCEGQSFESARAHVQHGGATAQHGLLNAEGPDAGDLPNLYVGADGRGFAEVFTTAVRLGQPGQGEMLLDADGAAILIHAMPDDHAAQPIGGSGDRVACGVLNAA